MSRLRASNVPRRRPPEVAEGSVVSVFRVPTEAAGQRLDVFVQSQLRRTSRTRTQRIVQASAYDLEGRRLKANDRVRAGQCVLLWRPPWDETPDVFDIPLLWEDPHLLALAKPALLPVHPTARYHHNTLIKLLARARPDCQLLSLGHRLDRETSGALLVSKTRDCDRALKRMFELRGRIQKTYVAITWGIPDRGDGARKFRYARRMELDPSSRSGVKMRIRDAPDALEAVTLVEVCEVRYGASDRVYALVTCGLETGRQHQIRLHLASLGAPIVGDKLYGPDERVFERAADGALTELDLLRLEMPRHALHACRLALPHPITGVPLSIEAPLPADMGAFWEGLQIPRGTLSRSS